MKLPGLRSLYPDESLAQDIRIAAMGAQEGHTLHLEIIHGIPRLVIRLKIDNVSPYKIFIRRLVGSIVTVGNRKFIDVVYEGWAIDSKLQSFSELFIDLTITDNQAQYLQNCSDDLIIKAAAEIVCGARASRARARRIIIKGPFNISTQLHVGGT